VRDLAGGTAASKEIWKRKGAGRSLRTSLLFTFFEGCGKTNIKNFFPQVLVCQKNPPF